jgi:hypothetical protein
MSNCTKNFARLPETEEPGAVYCARLWPLLLSAVFLAGCAAIASKNNTGFVVARGAQIRSSTAVVAADLLEVNRGDVVDILDSVDVPDPSDNTRKERWYRVRAHDQDRIEGWIEARNIMLQKVVDNSRSLADEDKSVPGQATGQLRASSNLRLSPDRSAEENIMMRLDSGSSFEIIGWKRVPKPAQSDTIETDVAAKPGSPQAKSSSDADSEDQSDEDTNELWYKVRLPTAISPAPEGWIYGKQVELAVPSDIIYYRRGREFVAWRRVDEETSDDASAPRGKDVAKESRTGSWIILEKSTPKEGHKLDEPDFDRIYVLGYDKHNQEHYTAYLSPDVDGYLPLRIEGRGSNKTFTVRIKDDSGQVKDEQYVMSRDDHGVLKVAPPGGGDVKNKKRR